MARPLESGEPSQSALPVTKLRNNYFYVFISLVLFGGTFIAILVQTLTLGLIIANFQRNQSDFGLLEGALVGLELGVGIAAFASLSHRLFGGESFKVWLIETTNDAINLTVAGVTITLFN